MSNTSLAINTTDGNGKKIQKALTDINPNASTTALKNFAQGLNDLTTNDYVGSVRVTKINLDDEDGDDTPASTKTARTGYILSAGSHTTLTTAVNVNTLGAYDYDSDAQLFGFNFTGDNAPIHVITGTDFTTAEIMITAPTSPPPSLQPSMCEHPFNIALFSAEETVSGTYTATLRVDESDNYQALDLVITIQGGNA